MYRRNLPCTSSAAAFALVFGLLFLAAPSDAYQATRTELSASSGQQRTIKLINYLVERYHYRKTKLNDKLSSVILDRYIRALDPNRSYFLADDIEQFEALRYRLDNLLLTNQLEPFFALFNIYRSRVLERVAQARTLLQRRFDFSIDENYRFDRSEAPWAVDIVELDDLWRRRVKNDYLGLKIAGQQDAEIVRTLDQRYQQVGRRTEQISSEDVFQTLVNAYVSAIEPHTGYFSPRATENFKIRMSLSLEGIGAVLQRNNEYTLVQRIVPGGAADLEGRLQAGDRIIGVAQDDDPLVDVIGWRLDDVVDLIRGPKGTTVRLQILPAEEGIDADRRVIAIVRDRIKLEEQAVKRSLLKVQDGGTNHRIGVIDIPTFYVDFDARARGDADYRSTTRDVRQLLAELRAEGIDGLIVDLRGNGGGALAEATSLTGLFIEAGPIVQVRDARGRIRINTDPDDGIAYVGPLAVLINRDSASASEIFAGAIQDYGRGLIVGEPTYGKGTVQNLIDLNRYSSVDDEPLGQLKITIAQFFRVNGDSTQHRGVVPDILLPTAARSLEHGERALDNALPWTQIKPAKFLTYTGAEVQLNMAELRALHQARASADPGFKYLLASSRFEDIANDSTEVSLLEANRSAERKQREATRSRLLDDLRQAQGLSPATDNNETNSIAADLILLETAQILSDAVFGEYRERLVVQIDNGSVPTPTIEVSGSGELQQ